MFLKVKFTFRCQRRKGNEKTVCDNGYCDAHHCIVRLRCKHDYAVPGTVTNTNLLPTTNFNVGDPVVVEYTFESSTPDSRPADPTLGLYDNPITSLSISIGTYTATSSWLQNLQVGNGYSGYDYFLVESFAPSISGNPLSSLYGPPLGDWEPVQFVLQFHDPSAMALDSDQLPLVALDPSKFVSPSTFISLTFRNSVAVLTSAVNVRFNPTIVPGPGALLKVSPSSYDFVNLTVGTCSTPEKIFTLSNTGNANLNISNINISNELDYDLNLSPLLNPCAPLGTFIPNIAPGGFCNIGIQFCPQMSGHLNNNLIVTSNDSNSPSRIPMAGTGIGASFDGLFPLDAPYNISAKFCDPDYLPRLEHTGIDIMKAAGSTVHSVCEGKVRMNATSDRYGTNFDNYWNSFLIIKHDCDGKTIFGYYGHIKSNLPNGTLVHAGDPVGNIREAYNENNKRKPSLDHLHFGLILDYLQKKWGTAPGGTTCQEIKSLGWRNPLHFFNW